MSRKRKIIKWALIAFVSFIVFTAGFGYWFISLLPAKDPAAANVKEITINDLPYLTEDVPKYRGKILAVVTSCSEMGESKKPTGYELTELSRAYYVFVANGFEVDVASPAGGKPSVIIDGDDVGEFDFAFLNDSEAQSKVNNTIAMKDVVPDDYVAVYFVGGKGTMFDFPQNQHIQSLVREYYEEGKVIGAVCHGPAAFVNVTLRDGSQLLDGKQVSSFTNKEELLLIKDARSIFPFLLQDKLIENGAIFNEGHMYLEKISEDGNLITGQNPWSTWAVAEAVVNRLGYKPKARIITGEENSIVVLNILEDHGYDKAKESMTELRAVKQLQLNRELIAMHSIVAVMQWNITKAIKIIGLLKHAKSLA
ncbi:type 1 glutamine amidotransferase domain-containing protein [Anditalea andensis]|uniref:Glutamine amidotransferase n=1 Tax=Anditalea andensis TaxID=1048983 RepID=A0A074KZ04_9BACT|nr:type 1 glutamine amidotransferase domain-containing protein [Anditalea andensis]KEO75201.1 glutamine amidotransferase [Anditalea andensis]